MPSVSTIPISQVVVPDADHEECPDCGVRFDSTTDAGCETCNDQFTYDSYVDWCSDDRFNAWDDDPNWAEDYGYEGCSD